MLPNPNSIAPQVDALHLKVAERIRTSLACNFPLPYHPIANEVHRRKHEIEVNPTVASRLHADAMAWLQAILDAPEADLVQMVRRGSHTIGRESPAGEEASRQMRTQAATAAANEAARPKPTPSQIVAAMTSRGITLSVGRGDELLAAPKELLTDQDRALLRTYKAAILGHLAASAEAF